MIDRRWRNARRAKAVVILGAGLAGWPPPAAHAQWIVRLEPMQMRAYGHDQHVLTIHEMNLGAETDSTRAVNLETESGFAYHGRVQYAGDQWTWGADFSWFVTSQRIPNETTAAADAANPVVFEIADRSHASTGPGEVLFYNVLEDTDVATWMLDIYGLRVLAATPETSIQLQLGLKFADFDNDQRAAVGIEGVGGTRIDAYSNYGRMTGLLVGLLGKVQQGSSTFEGHLSQSVVIGSPELSNMYREFTGPFSEEPAFVAEETFGRTQDVAIPITEARLGWTWQATGRIAIGFGASAAAWWDVPVPPGIVPGVGGDQVLHENTIVFFGLSGFVEMTF